MDSVHLTLLYAKGLNEEQLKGLVRIGGFYVILIDEEEKDKEER
jgi:hypothetical protein